MTGRSCNNASFGLGTHDRVIWNPTQELRPSAVIQTSTEANAMDSSDHREGSFLESRESILHIGNHLQEIGLAFRRFQILKSRIAEHGEIDAGAEVLAVAINHESPRVTGAP